MSVKNGARFLDAQLTSILCQLSPQDELVICDDHSTDQSINTILFYNDPRFKLLESPDVGVVASFEHALSACKGDVIFLADQDDIWAPNKISRMLGYLNTYDLVVCDCALVDEHARIETESFFQLYKSG